ncbi:universal stress protein [Natrialba sp. INN-245]|nr:universal stress protein [Natrialba sp. INN-245]
MAVPWWVRDPTGSCCTPVPARPRPDQGSSQTSVHGSRVSSPVRPRTSRVPPEPHSITAVVSTNQTTDGFLSVTAVRPGDVYATILVPVDGSDESRAAIEPAVGIARAVVGTVHALSVREPLEYDLPLDDAETIEAEADRRSREALTAVVDRAEADGVDVVSEQRTGVPDREIGNVVDERGIDLIVMGTRGATAAATGRAGRRDRTRIGSTVERVLLEAAIPVLAVPSDGPTWSDAGSGTPERIVVPVDGSALARESATHALEFAAAVEATVHVVHVIDETRLALDSVSQRLSELLREGAHDVIEPVRFDAQDRGLEVRTDVRRGVPAAELVSYTDDVDADLIAMGRRGGRADDRDDVRRRVLGGTAARVLDQSSRPVLTIG